MTDLNPNPKNIEPDQSLLGKAKMFLRFGGLFQKL